MVRSGSQISCFKLFVSKSCELINTHFVGLRWVTVVFLNDFNVLKIDQFTVGIFF